MGILILPNHLKMIPLLRKKEEKANHQNMVINLEISQERVKELKVTFLLMKILEGAMMIY